MPSPSACAGRRDPERWLRRECLSALAGGRRSRSTAGSSCPARGGWFRPSDRGRQRCQSDADTRRRAAASWRFARRSGANRGRLITQLLAESVLLSAAGAAIGLGIAQDGINALVALQPAGINRPEQIHLGWPVLLFTTAVSIGTAVLVGIIPALQAARADVNASLHTCAAATARSPRVARANCLSSRKSHSPASCSSALRS